MALTNFCQPLLCVSTGAVENFQSETFFIIGGKKPFDGKKIRGVGRGV
jgi:hypothetical protein